MYYRHYKGGLYKVTGVARHTETEELMVIYRAWGQTSNIVWARPYDMFFGKLEDGTPRFKSVEPPEDGSTS